MFFSLNVRFFPFRDGTPILAQAAGAGCVQGQDGGQCLRCAAISGIGKGDDYVFADTSSHQATIHLAGSFESGDLRCNRGKHLVPIFHEWSGGFALEIGGKLVAVDSRFSELCNHLFGIASVRGHELTH